MVAIKMVKFNLYPLSNSYLTRTLDVSGGEEYAKLLRVMTELCG